VSLLYERVLSCDEDPRLIQRSLDSVLGLAFEDKYHFNFLLDRVPWFETPYINMISVLEKTIRLYRGFTKEAVQVGYNILTDGMRREEAYRAAVTTVFNLAEDRCNWDWQVIMQSLRKNYPHKVCETKEHTTYMDALFLLANKFPEKHVDIIELVMENLVLMDT
jgi:hypothetical protein